ncbi:Transcriptional regulator, TetR family [Actinosynnema pretiosum subsp. pretiosum]|nr:Transcriptional regulator, TetR family [Actinosynnema pretiosum subsp. pretiosum]
MTACGAQRRTDLLDAAVSLVASGGSGSLTHRAVAAAAEVSLASVTYHFPSIEDLRRSMFERALQVVDDRLTATAATGPPSELPGLAADYVLALVTEHRDAAAAVQEMIVAAAHDPALRPTFHAYHERLADRLAPCVGGRTAGLAVAATLQGLVLTALAHPDLEPEVFHGAVLDLVDRLRVAP